MTLSFQFDTLSSFLEMGGYAFYVWLAYGTCGIAFALLIINSIGKRKSVIKQIAKKRAQEARLRQHRRTMNES